MTPKITLPEDLYLRLRREAERLELDMDYLVSGLVLNFLDKLHQAPAVAAGTGESPPETAPSAPAATAGAERRAHSRLKVDMTAMLHFREPGGKSAVYRAGGLKDIAPGGVLVEYDPAFPAEQALRPGSQVDLIFQLSEEEPPMLLECEVCRIDQKDGKTRLGVAFKYLGSGIDGETLRRLAESFGS